MSKKIDLQQILTTAPDYETALAKIRETSSLIQTLLDRCPQTEFRSAAKSAQNELAALAIICENGGIHRLLENLIESCTDEAYLPELDAITDESHPGSGDASEVLCNLLIDAKKSLGPTIGQDGIWTKNGDRLNWRNEVYRLQDISLSFPEP